MSEDFKLPVVLLHYHIFTPDSKIAEKWDWDEPSRVRGSYFVKLGGLWISQNSCLLHRLVHRLSQGLQARSANAWRRAIRERGEWWERAQSAEGNGKWKRATGNEADRVLQSSSISLVAFSPQRSAKEQNIRHYNRISSSWWTVPRVCFRRSG